MYIRYVGISLTTVRIVFMVMSESKQKHHGENVYGYDANESGLDLLPWPMDYATSQ